jgi:hypothetical protein
MEVARRIFTGPRELVCISSRGRMRRLPRKIPSGGIHAFRRSVGQKRVECVIY